MESLNDRQRFTETFRRALSKGNSKVEWAIQRGRLVKLWISAGWPSESTDVTDPSMEKEALIAFDKTVSTVFASGEIRISAHKIEAVNITEKADFEGRMREPRRYP